MSLSTKVSGTVARQLRPAFPVLGLRKFATAVTWSSDEDRLPGPIEVRNVAGIPIVARATNSPLSTMCLMIGAGSRDETDRNAGVASVARRLAFKTTKLHSQLALAREFELMGSQLTALSGRETTMIFAKTPREIARVVGLMAEELSLRHSPLAWEVDQAKKELAYEIDAVADDSVYLVMDALHRAAFRGPLTYKALPSKEHIKNVTQADVADFFKKFYIKENAVLASVGASEDVFSLAEEAFGSLPLGAKPERTPSRYQGGGETCIDAVTPTTTIAIGFEGMSLTSKDRLAAGVLQQVLGTGPLAKWGSVGGLLGKSLENTTHNNVQMNTFNQSYSDTGLFGVLIRAPADEVVSVVEKTKAILGELTKNKSKFEDDFKRGKAQAIKAILAAADQPTSLAENLARQVLVSGQAVQLEDMAAALDKMDVASITGVAEKIFRSKPCMASLGNVRNMPYLDQIA